MKRKLDSKYIVNKKFNDFTVYYYNDSQTFIHIEIKNTQNFYDKLADYFFDDNRLIKYAEGKVNIKFNSTRRDYTVLYRHLNMYIDDFNQVIEIKDLEEDIKKILLNEEVLEDENGSFKIRLDKIGKMGEYFFSCLLSEYFSFNCIIPKIHLTTDPNMNVYGIDTLFYNSTRDEILFGESKFSKSLDNGVGLIAKSLKSYETQIRDEYSLVLTNRILKDKLNIFSEKYGDFTDICIDIDEFINEAKIKSIGVPIFIAHGGTYDEKEILFKLSNIKRKDLFGIKTNYYCISLPVINKDKLVATITLKIKERMQVYNEQRKCN